MKVAWIGLGQMGLPTSKKVAAAGHEVRAYDIKSPAADEAEGLILCGSPGEAAEGCDLLCIAVFSDSQVEEVLTGPDGVMPRLKPGAVVAIFTTGSVESAQALAASAPPGIAVLDTCFSRMWSELSSGMLTLLVGGEAEAIERCRPAFDAFAREIFHIGPSGSGRKIKLVNNILFAAHLQVAADGLRLAEGLGLDRARTASALLECSGASDVMRLGQDPGEMLKMVRHYMVKDVGAATDAAASAGIDLGALGDATAGYLKP